MEKVIYTAIMGNYDSLKEPVIVTPGWKYVCYTNNADLKSNTWKIIFVNFTNVKQLRRIKIIVPFEYITSIWIDASIEVNCNLDEFIKKYHKGYFTVMKHPDRKCVYSEAEACIQRKKDNPLVIQNQVRIYKKMRYPSNNGMVATGLLIRTYCKEISNFCEKWWNEVNIHSKRDQLSFNYTLFINPIKYTLISFDVLSEEFKLYFHNRKRFV